MKRVWSPNGLQLLNNNYGSWKTRKFSEEKSVPIKNSILSQTSSQHFHFLTFGVSKNFFSTHPFPGSCCRMCACVLSHFSHIQFFATLWTVAYQSPLSMGFSRQEYWSGFPFPSPGKYTFLHLSKYTRRMVSNHSSEL